MNTDHDTEEQLRTLLQSGLGDVTAPPRLAERSMSAARVMRRRRTAVTAVAAVAVVAATTTLVATHPWASSDPRVEQLAGQPPALPGPGATDATLEQVAKGYAVERLGLPITRTLGSRRGGECAVYDLRDDRGVSHRVVLILQGDEPAYQPVYISQEFTLQEFVPDSDDACGMQSSNSLRGVDTAGTQVPVGPA